MSVYNDTASVRGYSQDCPLAGGGGEGEGEQPCTIELSGAAMVPPVDTPATGTATFTPIAGQYLLSITHTVVNPTSATIYFGDQHTDLGNANSPINVPRDARIERVVVNDSFDAADNWIAERAGDGDIVITADIPLADRALKKGAVVIGNTGVPFTASSIGMALANRELLSNLRAMGEVTGGPRPMSQRDRSRFLSTLDEAIQRMRRRGGTT